MPKWVPDWFARQILSPPGLPLEDIDVKGVFRVYEGEREKP
jgi:hypothetical protein